MHVRESERGLQEFGQGLPVRDRQPEHLRQLAERHLDADAGEESDQHGAGEEVRQEREPRHPGEQQQQPGQQGGQPGQADVPGRARDREAGQGRAENGALKRDHAIGKIAAVRYAKKR